MCGRDVKTERMSYHIQTYHPEFVYQKTNISLMKKSLAEGRGYTQIVLEHPTDKTKTTSLFISFSFKSGWKTYKSAEVAHKNMANEKLNAHIELCREYIKEGEKKAGSVEMVIAPSDEVEKLKKRITSNEKTIERYIKNNKINLGIIEVLKSLYNINEELYDDICGKVRGIVNDFEHNEDTVDEEIEALVKKLKNNDELDN